MYTCTYVYNNTLFFQKNVILAIITKIPKVMLPVTIDAKEKNRDGI